jgi:hypothetical protein
LKVSAAGTDRFCRWNGSFLPLERIVSAAGIDHARLPK